jgi:hypothetical protein
MASITTFGFCEVAPLSKYTKGFPFTFCESIGKSALILFISNILIYKNSKYKSTHFEVEFSQTFVNKLNRERIIKNQALKAY